MTLEKMTSRDQSALHSIRARSFGAAVLLVVALALGGCSLLPTGPADSGSVQGSPTTAAAKNSSEAEMEPTEPPTAAQELATRIRDSLTELAGVTKSPNRDQMMSAMLEAGAEKDKVELSIDITPTGLAVDAIESAAPVGEECVVGQVRDGNVAVTILPVLASGRCFVGDAH
ncbi:DUF6993 domain-containing protein [Arthrobacter antibioticus]|uniref:DUF6993 domain-containing protein n=1 Tax=Arthrobacter sp. H35-MC1 TaxID=3046203 RepID=UPI0024B8D77D|nr:hypothetical protein [Arthrobacter sp. H35-MC1]MDJ0316030.1 hypothetical protein [Arthrobacter sp. H35-MC1]